MDIRKIKKLIELIENSEISELEIEEGEGRVRLTRSNHKSNDNGASFVNVNVPE